jgi:hypothetical protein
MGLRFHPCGGAGLRLRVLGRWRRPCPVRGSVVRRGFGFASRSGPSAVERRWARQAERASARRSHPGTRDGDQADRGRARGSSWLQKSTSGARSGSKGPGLAGWLSRSRGGAQQVKRRRKPGRGGESHQHASSDTGGGLPAIPRVRRASVPRDRGREHSSMEGVRERRRPPPLTRRRRSRSSCPAATGTRQRCRVRREALTRTPEVVSQVRRAVENAAGGRFSAEEPSIGAPPGLRWTAHVNGRGLGSGRRASNGATLRGSRDGCSNGRSWRFAVKRSSTWLAHPASGSVDLPDLSGRRPRPRVSPC